MTPYEQIDEGEPAAVWQPANCVRASCFSMQLSCRSLTMWTVAVNTLESWLHGQCQWTVCWKSGPNKGISQVEMPAFRSCGRSNHSGDHISQTKATTQALQTPKQLPRTWSESALIFYSAATSWIRTELTPKPCNEAQNSRSMSRIIVHNYKRNSLSHISNYHISIGS